MKYSIHSFGDYNGQSYEEIQITNDHAQTIGFSNLGARITRWEMSDGTGGTENIVLGYEDAKDAFENHAFYYVPPSDALPVVLLMLVSTSIIHITQLIQMMAKITIMVEPMRWTSPSGLTPSLKKKMMLLR